MEFKPPLAGRQALQDVGDRRQAGLGKRVLVEDDDGESWFERVATDARSGDDNVLGGGIEGRAGLGGDRSGGTAVCAFAGDTPMTMTDAIAAMLLVSKARFLLILFPPLCNRRRPRHRLAAI